MRALVFSDVHGDQSIIARIKQEAKNCDLILCCGDITPVHGNTVDIARKIGKFDVTVLAIPGNFEMPDAMDKISEELGWINLHGKSVEDNGMIFFGCGGGNVGPFNTPYELTEDQFSAILQKFSKKDRFVFLSHCPPRGFLDRTNSGSHVGSPVIADFVNTMQPLHLFCGHIHEQGGKEIMIGKTKAYNVAKQIKVLDIK